jgi:hypothetical protein
LEIPVLLFGNTEFPFLWREITMNNHTKLQKTDVDIITLEKRIAVSRTIHEANGVLRSQPCARELCYGTMEDEFEKPGRVLKDFEDGVVFYHDSTDNGHNMFRTYRFVNYGGPYSVVKTVMVDTAQEHRVSM